MAKFEALDRIQASSHSPGEEGKAGDVNTVGLEILAAVEERSRDGCLTDAQLLEVFKQVCENCSVVVDHFGEQMASLGNQSMVCLVEGAW